jgi:hypothetical protein
MNNSDNGESNHGVIAVYKLQVFLYNVSKNTGGKIGEKCLEKDKYNDLFLKIDRIVECKHDPNTNNFTDILQK